jgi:hypothetical protein
MAALGMQGIFPLADRTTLIAIRSFTKESLQECRERGFSRPRSHVWHGTKEIAQVYLLHFMEALKESRRREARRVIATYAHLLADRDTLDGDNRH